MEYVSVVADGGQVDTIYTIYMLFDKVDAEAPSCGVQRVKRFQQQILLGTYTPTKFQNKNSKGYSLH